VVAVSLVMEHRQDPDTRDGFGGDAVEVH